MFSSLMLRNVAASRSYLTYANRFRSLLPTINSNYVRQMSHDADHSKIWKLERLFSAALLGTIPAALLYPTTLTESLMALSIVTHSHWGIEAIVVDYVRPLMFGSLIPKLAIGLVYVISSATLGGLMYIIYNDGGFVKIIQHIWAKK